MKKPMKELVKNEAWQNVRKSLLGKWTTEPVKCCQALSTYLGPIKTSTEDKLRIVRNYTTGTSFRLGKISHPCVKILRAKVSAELQMRKFKK